MAMLGLHCRGGFSLVVESGVEPVSCDAWASQFSGFFCWGVHGL